MQKLNVDVNYIQLRPSMYWMMPINTFKKFRNTLNKRIGEKY